MVDFRFDIRPLFPQEIIKVTSNLLPHTFRGDRRMCLDATSKMTEIIDRLGQLSATSQGLSKPVTSGQRLRMSENQTVYLLADTDAGHNGSVVGLLKVGTKDLYLFDETGQTRKIQQAPSILDFYVHESRQRSGLGKRLFQTMLSEEEWTPVKCSVDRPSDKLLAFLGKHYGLTRAIPQANNFVLFEGFFGGAPSANGHGNNAQSPQHTRNGGLHITNSPNTQLFGATYLGEDHRRRGSQQQQQAAPNLLQQVTQISPQGRYGARRPTCSMAESRHAGAGGAPIGRKNASEVSITPSQSRNQDNSRKSPLDALSRTSQVAMTRNQNPFQRRSGLQDVDDSFLAANAFARPPRVRHSGLERELHSASAPPVRMTAGQEPVQQQQQYQQMPPAGGEQQQQQVPPPVAAVPSAQQLMNQFAQQPAAGQPTRHEPMPSGRAHVHHQHMQQQQQQQQQQPAPVYEQQQPVAATPDNQNQNKYPTQQQTQQQIQQQQPQQTQQGYTTQQTTQAAAPPPASTGGAAGGAGGAGAAPAAGGASNNNAAPRDAPPDAEMCTTCPNCQTTIYLVRSPELGNGDGARPYNEM